MEETTKIEVAIPKKRPPLNPTEKLLRIIKIVLKLAVVDGYDTEGRVKSNGEAISGSSVVVLLNHAMSYGHALIGEDTFIQLLKEARVDPELIVNENVKNKLLSVAEKRVNVVSKPTVTTVQEPSPEPTHKRKLEAEEEPQNKRQRTENVLDEIGWEVPKKRKYDD